MTPWNLEVVGVLKYVNYLGMNFIIHTHTHTQKQKQKQKQKKTNSDNNNLLTT